MKIELIENKIRITVDDNEASYKLAYEVMNEFGVARKGNAIEIELQDSIRFKEILKNSNVEINDVESLKLIESLIEKNEKLKNEIEILKKSKFEELIQNEEFIEFKAKIEETLNIDFHDIEFGDITRKQSVKAFAMSKLNNVMNFSEPGSGKTLMTLMTLVSNLKEKEKVVIVSPKNSMNVWKAEIKKFLKYSNDEKLVHFYNDKMHSKFSDMPKKNISDIIYARFILINYESVQKISEHETLMEILSGRGYHIIFDEAHRIKNGLSIRNIRSKKLSKEAKTRVTLTGTPFSTSISEIKEMVDITWPNGNPFLSASKFDEYTSEISLKEIDDRIESIDEISDDVIDSIKNLANDISPMYFSLSKVKDFGIMEALDLYDDPILTKPLDLQIKLDRFIYEKIAKINQMLYQKTYPKKEKEDIEKIRNMLYTAGEQNLVNPYLLKSYLSFEKFFDPSEPEIPFEELPKIKATLRKVKQLVNEGKKVMIWFTFVNNIVEFKKLLIEEGIITEEIHGETDEVEKQKIIDSFARPESRIQVLISNPATIAESISLHKSVNESIFVERTLSYFRWAQAKDRIHRVGSKKLVTHSYIKNQGLKMEEKVFDNLKKKDLLAKEIFDKGPFNGIESTFALKKLEVNDLNEAGFEQEEEEYYNTFDFSSKEESIDDNELKIILDLEF